MMTNKEKFLQLVSDEDNNTLKEIKERIKNRAMLRESQQIAIKVLMKLDELGWTQKVLAQKMEVSPQQITKIVSGKENLTIETQIKLQNILDIPILATYYENKEKEKVEYIFNVQKKVVNIEKQKDILSV
jgi:DNA-binding XRE family transcriptional regulator